tara:strand:- start:4049 stop:4342 length:294 start_codon:yes stop_codon:yes gene_type:complete
MLSKYFFMNILLVFILLSKLILVILKFFKKQIINHNILTEEVANTLEEYCYYAFQISVSLLLIILFNPFTDKYLILTFQIKLFLFMYGVLGLIYYSK